MGARRRHGRAGVRAQRAHGHPRRQPARPRLLLRRLRRLRRPPNIARFTFLDPAGERFYPDWDSAADICVAILRTEAGRNPHDRLLHDLVGELSTRSDDFRTRWGRHDVRHHGTGTKRFHHPVVGELTLAYEGLEMAAEPGLTLTIYTAEPGSPSAERLQLLGSWAATPGNDPAAPPHRDGRADDRGRLMARVLVTGSTTGLGLAAATSLRDDGHDVILHARNRQRADDLGPLARHLSRGDR